MFNVEWENKILFHLNSFGDIQCLVCRQILKRGNKFTIRRHYDCCYSDLTLITGIERHQLISKSKKDIEIKNNLIANHRYDDNTFTDSQIKASYTIALALAKKGRPLEDGSFFKEMVLSILPFFGEAGKNFENIMKKIPLSPQTVTRRTEIIGTFLQNETNKRIEDAKFISVCFDESVNINDTSQMVICIRTIDQYFNFFEEILKLESFYGRVTGKQSLNLLKKMSYQ